MMKRAQESGALDLHIHNLRDWTTDKHHVVDDAPFGGGQGMVMKPEPIFAAVEDLEESKVENRNSKMILDVAARDGASIRQMATEFSQRIAPHHHLRALRRRRSPRDRTSGRCGNFDRRLRPDERRDCRRRVRRCGRAIAAGRARGTSNQRPMTASARDCSKVRNTRGQRSFADGKCRMFCSPGITPRSRRGEEEQASQRTQREPAGFARGNQR